MVFYGGAMNVINVDMLERELANIAVYANHEAARSWIRSVARNFILNCLTEKDIQSNYLIYAPPKAGVHSDLPPMKRLPAWAQKSVRAGVQLYWFDTTQLRRRPLWQSLEHIVHWFNSWPMDDKRYLRVTRIDFKSAASSAALWIKDVNENLWDYVKDNPPVIKAYENGYHWVRLHTQLHFERESRLMNHCVGTGGYYDQYRNGKGEYYSLRDKQNRPHVTVEVRVSGPAGARCRSVIQCKGNSNQKPSAEYQKYIRRFFTDMKWEIAGDHHNIA